MGKNIGKDISKSLSSKYSQKCLDHAKQPVTNTLKTSSKRIIQKQSKQLVISLVKILLIKSQKLQNINKKIIQRQLKIS